MRFFTDAQVAAVAHLHGIPMVVAHGLAADVALEQAIRAERQRHERLEARSRWLELTGYLLEKEDE